MSHWFPGMRTPKVLLLPPKNMDFWPKNGQIWPKICIIGRFGSNIGLSVPIGGMHDHKSNANEVPRWFSVMSVPKLLLPPKND